MTITEILEMVCREFGVKNKDIFSRRKTRSIALARAVAARVIQKRHHKSTPEIAKVLRLRTHSTVVRGLQRLLRAMEECEPLKDRVYKLERRSEHEKG